MQAEAGGEEVRDSAYYKIIDLVKDKLSPEGLRQLLFLLEQMDTESKRDILDYQRKQLDRSQEVVD